ncbi:hypothetical protein JVU11DRAFT_10758 [Chiua virens]|nr:hypothetical protein JVU11DRAFT_10758 [Chiua virens]
MLSSSVFKQAEEVLDDVLLIIQDDHRARYCALFETERRNYVEEEESLRKRLKEINDSASTSSIYSLRRLIGLPPLQASVCLEDAEKLRKRVKDEINERRRSTLTGRSSPFGSSIGVRMADRRLPVDDTSRSTNEIVTSPLNMQCSVSELPELNVDPTFEDGPDIRIDMNEAMSTPIRPIKDRMSDLYHDFQPERMSPSPSPSPPIVRVAGSSISETPESPRRSRSVRGPPLRSPQPTRQSRIHSPRSPAMLPSIASFPQEPETYGWQGIRANEDYTSKTNCVDIRGGSIVEGMTINNGGSNNSGAVIHKMIPQRFPQTVS